VRIKFDDLPRHCLPRSSTARFTEKWQKSVGDEGFLEAIVDRWRNSSSTSAADAAHQVTLFAEAMSLHNGPTPEAPTAQSIREPMTPISEPRRGDVPSIRREPAPAPAAGAAQPPGNALRAIRDRLQQR
jgi:hypothetical protein